MLDLAGISERVIAAVAGAIILGVGSLLWKRFQQQKPIEWFDVANGHTTNGDGGYENSVSYSHLLIRNKSRSVVEDISVLFDDSIDLFDVPKGTQAAIETDGKDSRVRIDAIQPRSTLLLKVTRKKSQYLSARKVFVGKHDVGGSVFFKYVKNDAIMVPYWVLVALIAISVNALVIRYYPANEIVPELSATK